MTDHEDTAVHYLAYLVRLRRDGLSAPWRVTLEDPHTDERQSFATLEQFVLFLEKRTGEIICPPDPDKSKSGNN